MFPIETIYQLINSPRAPIKLGGKFDLKEMGKIASIGKEAYNIQFNFITIHGVIIQK